MPGTVVHFSLPPSPLTTHSLCALGLVALFNCYISGVNLCTFLLLNLLAVFFLEFLGGFCFCFQNGFPTSRNHLSSKRASLAFETSAHRSSLWGKRAGKGQVQGGERRNEASEGRQRSGGVQGPSGGHQPLAPLGARSPAGAAAHPCAGRAPALLTPRLKPVCLTLFSSWSSNFQLSNSFSFPLLSPVLILHYEWLEKMLAVSTAKSLTSEFKVQKRLHDASVLFQLMLF